MTEGLDLHLGVDKGAGFVGRALETALREAIRSGRLHPGARLPGSRSLAADLGISRGTVVQAYAQLVAEGWLTGTTGSGTRVADLPGPAPAGAAAGGGRRGGPRAGGGAARGRPAARTPGPQFIPPNGLGFERPPRPGRRTLRGPGLRRARWPAGAARRGGRLRDPGPGRPRRRRRRGDHGRVHAGPGAAGPGAGPARDADRGHRGPRSGRHRDVLHAAGLATVPLEVGPAGADPDGLAPGRLTGRAPCGPPC